MCATVLEIFLICVRVWVGSRFFTAFKSYPSASISASLIWMSRACRRHRRPFYALPLPVRENPRHRTRKKETPAAAAVALYYIRFSRPLESHLKVGSEVKHDFSLKNRHSRVFREEARDSSCRLWEKVFRTHTHSRALEISHDGLERP